MALFPVPLLVVPTVHTYQNSSSSLDRFSRVTNCGRMALKVWGLVGEVCGYGELSGKATTSAVIVSNNGARGRTHKEKAEVRWSFANVGVHRVCVVFWLIVCLIFPAYRTKGTNPTQTASVRCNVYV